MFLDGLLQIFATQIFACNVTRAVDQEIRRQSGNVICTYGRRVTALEVAYADPWQLLLLDGIQDPGNLGTMLRTADALNVPVVLLEGCADPYSHKVVRASMGAVFRCPAWSGTLEQLRALLDEAKLPLLGAALREDTVDVRQADLKRAAMLVGSEGRGLSEDALNACDQTVRIPMSERCESLNAAVAAATLLWEGYR